MYDERIFPMIALRGITIFPNTVLSFDIGREKSIAAVKECMDHDRMVFLTTQIDIKTDDPTPEDVYGFGCVARIRQIVKSPNGGLRATVEGVSRGILLSQEEGVSQSFYSVSVHMLEELECKADADKQEALIRLAQEAFDVYAEVVDRVPPDVLITVIDATEPGFLADFIANNCNFRYNNKQTVLETLDPIKRLETVLTMLYRENEILLLEEEVQEHVREAMDENQREYYIREQIKELSSQLGVADDPMDEGLEYRKKIETLPISEDSREKLLREVDKFSRMPVGSHDAAALRTYFNTLLSLPWGIYTKDRCRVDRAEKVLNKQHYGLKKVKERILEFIAVRQLAPDINGQIICLVGPPGTGKTSIAKSIAEAMNRKYVRVSLGGVHDEAEIRGHRKTYIAAMPGRIIDAISQAKSCNPLVLLDEVDKLGKDYHGDPSSALLEVLDGEQNATFHDNYLEIPFDLSRVLFLATANDPDEIPGPLRDRMEIIELTSYTAEEKKHIAMDHLVVKELKKHGLSARKVHIDLSAIELLIHGYTREAGVRELERKIASLCRKAAKLLASGTVKMVRFTDKNIQDYLGPVKYVGDEHLRGNHVGIANGLAWTAVGGEMLQIEVNVMEGDGKLELTGSLGDIMKESARAAISFLRANGEKYGLSADFYKKHDIHVHVPDGATPKDGPSAGITITSAILSALTGRPFNGEVAMTGEITIRGRVLPIGGLKEKSMAAYKNGMKTVVIPSANERDLYDVDEVVKKAIRFIQVSDYAQVVEIALLPVEHLLETEEKKRSDVPIVPLVNKKRPSAIGQ